MPTRQTRRVLLSRPFLLSRTSVLRTRNCGTTSENSDTITPLRQMVSKGRGSGVISYGQSLRHARRGRKSPMTRNLNASTSASGGPERSSDETNRDASNDVSGKPSESSSSSRARPTRHHPEGTPGGHFVPKIHIAILFRLFFHVAKT